MSAAKLFNPWTGERRNPRDVISDPQGTLMMPPNEPLRAHKSKEELAPRTHALLAQGLGMVALRYALESLCFQLEIEGRRE